MCVRTPRNEKNLKSSFFPLIWFQNVLHIYIDTIMASILEKGFESLIFFFSLELDAL